MLQIFHLSLNDNETAITINLRLVVKSMVVLDKVSSVVMLVNNIK